MNTTKILEADDIQKWFNGEEVEKPKEEITEVKDIDAFFEEEKPEAKVEEVEKPKEEIKPEPVVQKTNFYTDLVREYIADGDFTDGTIEIEGENGEVQELILSEIEDITPEMFKAIKAAQKKLEEEQRDKDYVSVKGLDETTRKMITLKKSGGDISELIQVEAEHVHPLKGLDIRDEKVQEYLVRRKYESQGIDPEFIDLKIKKLKENVQLDLEAEKVVGEINTNFDRIVQDKVEKQEAYNKELQNEQKEFRKTMTETVRKFGLKDTLTKTLVDYASKYDDDGLTEADKLYFSIKQNPELFAEAIFLMTNKEAYDEYKGVKIKNEVKKDTIKSILRITPKTSVTPTQLNKVDKVEEFFNT